MQAEALSVGDARTVIGQLMTVISGGQSGADIGGLRGARALGLHTRVYIFGGFTPVGGEDLHNEADEVIDCLPGVAGSYAAKLQLRTVYCIGASDATIVFLDNKSRPTPGSRLTIERAGRMEKPLLVVGVRRPQPASVQIANFLSDNPGIGTLNIAGSRGLSSDVVAQILRWALNIYSSTLRVRASYE